MNIRRSLRLVSGLCLVPVLVAGCGAGQGTPSPTIATPTPTPAEPDVNVTSEVVFATPLEAKASEWRLDIYAPREPGAWPVVLFAHGAGGNRKGHAELSETLAKRGAVVFTFDWPDLVDDVAMMDDGRGIREIVETMTCAVRFASARGPEFGGSPERVILGGHSYGAIIAVWIGLVGEDGDSLWGEFAAARGGPPPQVECVESGGSAQLHAIVGVAGAYDWWNVPRYWEKDAELMAIADPNSHIGKNGRLRVRMIVGENDEDAYVAPAIELDEALAEAGYDTELTLWNGKHSVPIELTVDTILAVAAD